LAAEMSNIMDQRRDNYGWWKAQKDDEIEQAEGIGIFTGHLPANNHIESIIAQPANKTEDRPKNAAAP